MEQHILETNKERVNVREEELNIRSSEESLATDSQPRSEVARLRMELAALNAKLSNAYTYIQDRNSRIDLISALAKQLKDDRKALLKEVHDLQAVFEAQAANPTTGLSRHSLIHTCGSSDSWKSRIREEAKKLDSITSQALKLRNHIGINLPKPEVQQILATRSSDHDSTTSGELMSGGSIRGGAATGSPPQRLSSESSSAVSEETALLAARLASLERELAGAVAAALEILPTQPVEAQMHALALGDRAREMAGAARDCLLQRDEAWRLMRTLDAELRQQATDYEAERAFARDDILRLNAVNMELKTEVVTLASELQSKDRQVALYGEEVRQCRREWDEMLSQLRVREGALAARVKTLQDEQEKLKEQMQEGERRNKELRGEVEDLQESLEKAQELLRERDSKIRSLLDLAARYRDQRDETWSECSEAKNMAKRLETTREHLEETRISHEKEMKELRAMLAERDNHLSSLQRELGSARLSIHGVTTEVANMRDQLGRARRELETREMLVRDLQQRLDLEHKEAQALAQKIQNELEEKERLVASTKDLRQEIQHSRRLEEAAKVEARSRDQTSRVLADEVVAAQRDLSFAREEAAALQEEALQASRERDVIAQEALALRAALLTLAVAATGSIDPVTSIMDAPNFTPREEDINSLIRIIHERDTSLEIVMQVISDLRSSIKLMVLERGAVMAHVEELAGDLRDRDRQLGKFALEAVKFRKEWKDLATIARERGMALVQLERQIKEHGRQRRLAHFEEMQQLQIRLDEALDKQRVAESDVSRWRERAEQLEKEQKSLQADTDSFRKELHAAIGDAAADRAQHASEVSRLMSEIATLKEAVEARVGRISPRRVSSPRRERGLIDASFDQTRKTLAQMIAKYQEDNMTLNGVVEDLPQQDISNLHDIILENRSLKIMCEKQTIEVDALRKALDSLKIEVNEMIERDGLNQKLLSDLSKLQFDHEKHAAELLEQIDGMLDSDIPQSAPDLNDLTIAHQRIKYLEEQITALQTRDTKSHRKMMCCEEVRRRVLEIAKLKQQVTLLSEVRESGSSRILQTLQTHLQEEVNIWRMKQQEFALERLALIKERENFARLLKDLSVHSAVLDKDISHLPLNTQVEELEKIIVRLRAENASLKSKEAKDIKYKIAINSKEVHITREENDKLKRYITSLAEAIAAQNNDDIIKNLLHELEEIRTERDQLLEIQGKQQIESLQLHNQLQNMSVEKQVAWLKQEVSRWRAIRKIKQVAEEDLFKYSKTEEESLEQALKAMNDGQKVERLTEEIYRLRRHRDKLIKLQSTVMAERASFENKMENISGPNREEALHLEIQRLRISLAAAQLNIPEDAHESCTAVISAHDTGYTNGFTPSSLSNSPKVISTARPVDYRVYGGMSYANESVCEECGSSKISQESGGNSDPDEKRMGTCTCRRNRALSPRSQEAGEPQQLEDGMPVVSLDPSLATEHPSRGEGLNCGQPLESKQPSQRSAPQGTSRDPSKDPECTCSICVIQLPPVGAGVSEPKEQSASPPQKGKLVKCSCGKTIRLIEQSALPVDPKKNAIKCKCGKTIRMIDKDPETKNDEPKPKGVYIYCKCGKTILVQESEGIKQPVPVKAQEEEPIGVSREVCQVKEIGTEVESDIIEPKKSEIPSKVSEIPSKVSEIPSKVSEIPSKVSEIPSKVSEIPSKVSESPCKVSESPSKVSEIPSKVSEIPSKVSEIPSKVSEIPSKVSEIPSKVSEIPSKVSEIPSKVSEIPSKVSEVPCKVSESPSKKSQGTITEEVPRDGGGERQMDPDTTEKKVERDNIAEPYVIEEEKGVESSEEEPKEEEEGMKQLMRPEESVKGGDEGKEEEGDKGKEKGGEEGDGLKERMKPEGGGWEEEDDEGDDEGDEEEPMKPAEKILVYASGEMSPVAEENEEEILKESEKMREDKSEGEGDKPKKIVPVTEEEGDDTGKKSFKALEEKMVPESEPDSPRRTTISLEKSFVMSPALSKLLKDAETWGEDDDTYCSSVMEMVTSDWRGASVASSGGRLPSVKSSGGRAGPSGGPSADKMGPEEVLREEKYPEKVASKASLKGMAGPSSGPSADKMGPEEESGEDEHPEKATPKTSSKGMAGPSSGPSAYKMAPEEELGETVHPKKVIPKTSSKGMAGPSSGPSADKMGPEEEPGEEQHSEKVTPKTSSKGMAGQSIGPSAYKMAPEEELGETVDSRKVTPKTSLKVMAGQSGGPSVVLVAPEEEWGEEEHPGRISFKTSSKGRAEPSRESSMGRPRSEKGGLSKSEVFGEVSEVEYREEEAESGTSRSASRSEDTRPTSTGEESSRQPSRGEPGPSSSTGTKPKSSSQDDDGSISLESMNLSPALQAMIKKAKEKEELGEDDDEGACLSMIASFMSDIDREKQSGKLANMSPEEQVDFLKKELENMKKRLQESQDALKKCKEEAMPKSPSAILKNLMNKLTPEERDALEKKIRDAEEKAIAKARKQCQEEMADMQAELDRMRAEENKNYPLDGDRDSMLRQILMRETPSRLRMLLEIARPEFSEEECEEMARAVDPCYRELKCIIKKAHLCGINSLSFAQLARLHEEVMRTARRVRWCDPCPPNSPCGPPPEVLKLAEELAREDAIMATESDDAPSCRAPPARMLQPQASSSTPCTRFPCAICPPKPQVTSRPCPLCTCARGTQTAAGDYDRSPRPRPCVGPCRTGGAYTELPPQDIFFDAECHAQEKRCITTSKVLTKDWRKGAVRHLMERDRRTMETLRQREESMRVCRQLSRGFRPMGEGHTLSPPPLPVHPPTQCPATHTSPSSRSHYLTEQLGRAITEKRELQSRLRLETVRQKYLGCVNSRPRPRECGSSTPPGIGRRLR